MNDSTVSIIFAVIVIFGASTVPAFAPENRQRSLRWKIKCYLTAVSVWAIILIAISGGFWLATTSEMTKDKFEVLIEPSIIILIPCLVTAVAMWRIDRTPSLYPKDHK